MKFVDGTSICPPKFIQSTDPDANTNPTINPDYYTWIKSDQTLMIWLNATISEEILPYSVGCHDSFSLWNTLETRLAHLSRSHILQLKSQLQQIRKGDSTVTQYLQRIREITENLAAAGHIVDDLDLVFHILDGLPSDFDSFSTSMRVRDPPVTSDVLHNLLLGEELCIANRIRRLGGSITDGSTQAFHTYSSRPSSSQSRGSYSNNRGRGRSPMRGNYHQPPNSRNTTPSTPDSNYLQPQNKCFSQFFSTTHTKPVCQICKKPNHSAIDCYHRMNFVYFSAQT
ncbi:hypothetical protein ACHQM5_023101 [Ranunculus cassubicifolius]